MAGQGSARVSLREIDLSQVRNPQQTPQGVPAAVVGPARKGPAFVPRTFANMQQFNEVFGSMLEQDREANSNLYGPLALNEWMKSSQAGTYLRVLGVGDGKPATSGKTNKAGFIVGEELVQEVSDNVGKVGKNPKAEISQDSETDALKVGRTYFLGCFMKDKEDSRFLCDSGVQAETSQATIAKVFDLNGLSTEVVNNGTQQEAQLFIPKEIINSVATAKVSDDVTLTFKFKNNLTADVSTLSDDVVEVDAGASDADIADYLILFLNLDSAVSVTGVTEANKYQYNKISINPREVFGNTAAEEANDTAAVTFNLPAGKEGDEAFIVQSVGGNGLIIDGKNVGVKSFFTGATLATPVIRGVLMTPQGIRPALNPTAALDQFTDVAHALDNGSIVNPRKESHSLDFGATAGNADDKLVGYVVGDVDSSQSFRLILNGYRDTENPAVLNCSFDPDSPSYFAKVLNTDPTKIEELGHYLYAYWDVDKDVSIPANDGLKRAGNLLSKTTNYESMIGFLVAGEGDGNGRRTESNGKPNYEDFSSKYSTAKTPWIVSQFSQGQNTSARQSTGLSGGVKKLFRLHALDDGKVSNGQYRLLISNLGYNGDSDYGTFTLALEKFDSNAITGETLISWSNANLNPNSRNFIGRLIGDMQTYYDFESDEGKQKLVQKGQYEVKNSFVRIELSQELKTGLLPVDLLPTGFHGHSHLFTKSDGNFVEKIAAENMIFTNDDNNAGTETLSQAQVLPMDFVKSINRIVGDVQESDDDLAWGVKFSKRENIETSKAGHKELSEQVFNRSISSWAKFFPSFGSNPALISNPDQTDLNQNSFFSLEKILIPSSSLDASGDISSWDGALYKRKSFTPHSGDRYVTISQDAKGSNSKFLKFRCMFQGGFDGTNIFDKEKSEFSGTASLREGQDETGTQDFVGPTIMSFRRAVDVLSDKSSLEFQLLSIPGQRSRQVTDYAIDACENRFDSLFIMDIEQKDAQNIFIEDLYERPSVMKTIKEFEKRVLDSSFAAAYFPDVLMRRPSDNAPILVPPTVGMMGVMSRNDSIADPWFAPAGLNRGKLNAFESQVQMNRDVLDSLYDADINPIYVPAGREGEVYAFGQKTLLQDASALDRINVRRLLIDIRRKVKKVGEQLLFEPNRASTLSKFSSLVEPIMADVQQRRGVERYKVQIDTTTTTQNDIENNTIRGKIYLQPTKSIEFISLDFVVANTIQ